MTEPLFKFSSALKPIPKSATGKGKQATVMVFSQLGVLWWQVLGWRGTTVPEHKAIWRGSREAERSGRMGALPANREYDGRKRWLIEATKMAWDAAQCLGFCFAHLFTCSLTRTLSVSVSVSSSCLSLSVFPFSLPSSPHCCKSRCIAESRCQGV